MQQFTVKEVILMHNARRKGRCTKNRVVKLCASAQKSEKGLFRIFFVHEIMNETMKRGRS